MPLFVRLEESLELNEETQNGRCTAGLLAGVLPLIWWQQSTKTVT
jgi:hypothetical protein